MSCCGEDPVVVVNTNINVHVKGWIVDPRVTMVYKPAPATNRTVRFAILDINGMQVSDTYTTTLEAGSESKTWDLGDYINAQRVSRNIPPGIYFIAVQVVEGNFLTAIPVFLVDSATTIPRDSEYPYLNHISIIDKATGFLMRLPPQVDVVPLDDRYMVFLYYHKGKKGRLAKIGSFGQVEWDTGYHTYVELELKLQFNTTRDLLYYMLQRSWNIPANVMKAIVDRIEAGQYIDALNIAKALYRGFATSLGRTKVDVDAVNNILTERVFVYLGWIDWGKVFGWGAIGCAVGVAVAVTVTALTAGVGSITLPLVAGACLAGGLIGAGMTVVTSGESKGESAVRQQAEQRVTEAKTQIENEINNAKSILDKLLNEGRITQDEYNKLLQHLANIKEISFRTFDELLEDVKKAFDEGYRKGLEESKAWIMGAGLGGLLLGFVLGQR